MHYYCYCTHLLLDLSQLIIMEKYQVEWLLITLDLRSTTLLMLNKTLPYVFQIMNASTGYYILQFNSTQYDIT